MTNNEKSLWFLLTIIGFAVIWLWLRSSKGGQTIINKISEALNLPGLVAPIIDLGEAGDYAFELGELPPAPSLDKTCCPTCSDVQIARGARPPYELARPQAPVVYEHLRYQTVYQPMPLQAGWVTHGGAG